MSKNRSYKNNGSNLNYFLLLLALPTTYRVCNVIIKLVCASCYYYILYLYVYSYVISINILLSDMRSMYKL